MEVAVHLFARARELVGESTVRVEVARGATVADLRSCLTMAFPKIGPIVGRSVFAVNSEVAGDDWIIPDGAEVALVPPVSGGKGLSVHDQSH